MDTKVILEAKAAPSEFVISCPNCGVYLWAGAESIPVDKQEIQDFYSTDSTLPSCLECLTTSRLPDEVFRMLGLAVPEASGEVWYYSNERD